MVPGYGKECPKMKKWISVVVSLAVTAALSGCGGNGAAERIDNQTAGVNEVLEAGIAEAESKETDGGRQSGLNEGAPTPVPVDASEELPTGSGDADIDLTVLSSTMVYSQVYDIVYSPQNYVGKTIKMKGMFSDFYNQVTDKHYFACIIQDATACCSQGIEFILSDQYVYPDDYPKSGEECTVKGVFNVYQEGKYTYCTLQDAELL